MGGIGNFRHGMSRTSTYRTWSHMKGRCSNPNEARYKDYGGRGIKVCERWMKFENFLEDMGEKPDNKTLDRIDNDGDYCPENCRWATIDQQSRNTRRSKIMTYNGKTQPMIDWAEELGISYAVLKTRTRRGWTTERALGTPVR